MAVVYPSYNRAVIEKSDVTLCITIPVARTLIFTVILVIWLVLLVHLELGAIAAFLKGAPLEDLAIKTILLGAFIVMALWYFAGKEIIEVDATTLTRIRQIPLFGHVRKYKVANITNLRLGPDPWWLPSWLPAQRVSFMTFTGGRIAFDYRGRTRRLGLELSDTDAESIIEAIRKHVTALHR